LKDIWNTEETHNKTYSAIEVHAMKREFIADLKQMAIDWIKELKRVKPEKANLMSRIIFDSELEDLDNEHNKLIQELSVLGEVRILMVIFNITEEDLKET